MRIRSDGGSQRITINDVARLSGVSPATVTRALQGHPRVRAETRREVERAAQLLGYRPHVLARALATGTTTTVGLLIPDVGDPYWTEIAAGIEEHLSGAGFSVLFGSTHSKPENERRLLEIFLGNRVAGIVVGGIAGDLAALPRPHPPIVLVSADEALDVDLAQVLEQLPEELRARETSLGADRATFEVASDDVKSARSAVEYLVGLGHERLAFVGARRTRSSLLRSVGFLRAVHDTGVEGNVVASEPTLESAAAVARALLEPAMRPSALVAYDDVVAIGAIRAAHALGLHVPGDVSVMGFDDIAFAAFVEPPLTTIQQPKHEMGRLAARLVLESARADVVRHRHLLPGTLVVRESTGPAPAGRARGR